MNMKNKGGQTGTEIIIILGIVIIILMNVIGIYNQVSSSSGCQSAAATARAALDSVADMAEIVHTQAVGSRSKLFINLPGEIGSIAIGNNTIRMGVSCGTSVREVSRAFAFNVTGSLEPVGGTQLVYVESLLPYVLISGTPTNLTLGEYLCGNGYRELGEKCDLRSTGNRTCVDMGYRGGVLQCTIDCDWDLSTCEADSPPIVTLSTPAANVSIENVSTVILDCHVLDDFALTHVSIWTNLSGGWNISSNCSASGIAYNCSVNVTTPSGWSSWGCKATDDINQTTWSETRHFFVTNVTPTIFFMSPIDGWSFYSSRGVEITTLLTMSEISPQWQAEALIGSMINWLLSTSGECECGTDIGACRQNVQQCVGGAWGLCEGTPPINEVCNGADDDCNGLIDEDILCACTNNTIEICGSDVGICSLGNRTCTNNTWTACIGGTQPQNEVCDGLDNDCDGVTDDITPQECGVSNVGECAMGVQYCTAGEWGGCDGAVLPNSEVCDNLDNDCDTLVDEVNCVCTTGSTRACPTMCGSGLQTCEDGFWGACSELTGPQPEICNGVDDNCDGRIDDGLSRACGCDCADNKILVVLDRNHHDEDITDVNYTLNILDLQHINYTFMNEPVNGLLLNDTEGYNLVWFINPGWPPDTRTTLQTLITLNQQGIPIVLHGDDMTWGMTEISATDPEPLTGLRHINNGLDTNYSVTFADKDHPVLTYLRGRNFIYKNDDIDTSTIIDSVATTSLATGYAILNPSYTGPAIAVRDTIDTINVTLVCQASSPYPIQRIEIWTNLTGPFAAIGSCEINSTVGNCSMDIPMGFGTLVWNCFAMDIRGASSFAPANYTLHRVSEDLNTYGLIVADNNNNLILALNPFNGSRIWQGNTTNNPDSIGVGDGNKDGKSETYFATTNMSYLGALSSSGGNLWNRTISGDTVKTPRLIAQDGFAYWASAAGKVYKTNGTTGVDAWSSTGPFPGSDGGLRVITLGDVDHDAYPDIFAADWLSGKGYVRCYNGNSGSVRWSVNVGNTIRFSANKLLAMDANADGYSDAIYGSTNGRIYALNGRTGSTLWTSPSGNALGTSVTYIALGNFSADSVTDIVAMGSLQSAIYTFNGQTGALIWRHVVANGNGNILETADLNRDGYSDVIYGNVTAKTITTINGRTNTTMWSAPSVSTAETKMTLWDANRDGYPDIIAGQANGALRAINGRNGSVIWTGTDASAIDGQIAVGVITP